MRSTRSGVLAVLVAAAAAALVTGAPRGQSAPERERPSVFEERSEVRLALIEAVVLDRRGRHVRGLDAAAFRLTEGDREVPIVSFDEIDIDRARADAPRAAPAQAPDADTSERDTPERDAPERDTPERDTPERDTPEPPAASQAAVAVDSSAEAAAATPGLSEEMRRAVERRLDGPRWFVLTFDGYNNVSALRMSQVRNAAKKWVDQALRPGDRVAVFELTPYLASVVGFTDDVESIRRAIDRVRVFPAGSMGEELIAQRLEQGGLLPRNVLESQMRNAGTFGAELLAAERDQFYVSLADLADVLQGFEGTRSIVLFSGGFPVTLTRATGSTGGFTVRFKRMLQSLERLGIRVFTFDIGEEGSFTDASESNNFRIALDNLGFGADWLDDLQIGAQIDSHHAHQEILSVLGNETGGRFWRTRAYADGLRAVADDLSHYYLIGYTPGPEPESARDYVPIKVRVDGRGNRVVTRRGRFVDRARPVEASAESAPRPATPPVVVDPESAQPLLLTVRPLFYPGESGRTLIVLPVHIDGPLEGVSVSAEQSVLDFDVVVEAIAAGETIESGTRSIRVTYDGEQEARFAGGLHVREAILLPPAALELRVAARLNGAGRSGEWRSTLVVPERSGAGFGLTELALLAPADPAPQVFDVFAGDEPVHGTHPSRPLPDPLGDAERERRPPVDVDARHSRGVPLLAQVRVSSPPAKTAEVAQPLRMDWELVPAGGGEPLAPPVRYRRLALDAGELDVVVDLDLAAVEPGDYTLRLTAVDLVRQGRAERRQPLTVVP